MPASKHLILTFAAAAALTACGGGGSDPSPVSPAPTPPAAAAARGVMIDGYVRGATVYCDANGNGVRDAAESATTTSSTGAYDVAGGCNGSVIGFGGTNVDTGFAFAGQLKTPAGSSVMTPLTTLLVGTGLTTAQLAELLGQPVGTDVTKIDVANGLNADLLKKTLAVQQVIDSVSRLAASKSGTTDLAAVYSRVAADFAKTLSQQTAGTQLISAAGALNNALLSNVVKALPDVVSLGIPAADSEAAVVALAAQAQQFASASTAELAALTQTLQNPTRPTVDAARVLHYVSLAGDGIGLNGNNVTLAQLRAGTSVAGLRTIGLELSVTGRPAADTTSAMALELVERGGSNRKLQLMIDAVRVTVDDAGKVGVTVPAASKVYAYGTTRSGTEINLTISDLTFTPITVVNNGFSLNYDNMVRKVLASVDAGNRPTAEQFVAIRGSFDMKVVISKLNLRSGDNKPLDTQTVSIANTALSVTGAGFSGALTVD